MGTRTGDRGFLQEVCTRCKPLHNKRIITRLNQFTCVQVLDRVDIVVGERRNKTDTSCRVPSTRDGRRHLVSRKLTALTRLGTLGHLDL